jgi:hypothetical protein
MTKACIDIETFTWKNLQADIFRDQHANAMRLYLESVVTPALDIIEARYDEMSQSDEPAAVFGLGDVYALRRSTIEAFALSIQSLWERQLRGFLKDCAHELKSPAASVGKLSDAEWPKLVKKFQEFRGLQLESFDSFRDLELLQLLGNACRHGDGKSTRTLFERWPEFWPNWPPATPVGWSRPPLANVPNYPSFSQASLPRSLLVRLAHAVIWFWEDHNYIYINSITPKHSDIDGFLAKIREERAGRRREVTILAPKLDEGSSPRCEW